MLFRSCEEIAAHTSAKLFNLSDYEISHFDYNFENQNDDFIALINEILSYDKIVLASPVYWYSASAIMKTFLDRLSDLLKIEKPLGRLLKTKPVSLIATGCDETPAGCFEQAFQLTYEYLGMNYLGMLYCACEDDFQASLHQQNINAYLEVIDAK